MYECDSHMTLELGGRVGGGRRGRRKGVHQ